MRGYADNGVPINVVSTDVGCPIYWTWSLLHLNSMF